MEQQGPSFGLEHLSVILETDDLARSEANDRTFLIVVILAPVDHIAALDLFQEYGIKSVGLALVRQPTGLRHVDHADQRMQGFDAHAFVILKNIFDVYDLIHSFRIWFRTNLMFFTAPASLRIRNR